MTVLSRQAEQLLAKYLARQESPWRPVRQHWDHARLICAARSRGLQGDGGDARSRKTEQRTRDELAAAGLTHSLALTDDGKRLARSWTWPYLPTELQAAVDRITERTAAGDCRLGGWVPETLIAGAQWDDADSLAALQSMFIPLLADGVIESASTVAGQAFYRLTAEWKAKSDQLALPDNFADRADLTDVYYREYKATWQAILSDNRSYQDIGSCPLPLNQELSSGRDYEDLTGIEPLFSKPTKSKRKAK